MRQFFLIVIIILSGLKFGFDYVTSNKFQVYADKKKEPWTCKANLLLGDFYQLMDKPDVAKQFFDPVAQRCPKSLYAAEAVYKSIYSIDQMDLSKQALGAYERYLIDYPDSPFIPLVNKHIRRISNAKAL